MRKFYESRVSGLRNNAKETDQLVIMEFFDKGGIIDSDGNIIDFEGNLISTKVTAGVEYMRYHTYDKTKQYTVPAILLKGFYKYGDIVFNENVKCFYEYRDNKRFLLSNLMINVVADNVDDDELDG